MEHEVGTWNGGGGGGRDEEEWNGGRNEGSNGME